MPLDRGVRISDGSRHNRRGGTEKEPGADRTPDPQAPTNRRFVKPSLASEDTE